MAGRCEVCCLDRFTHSSGNGQACRRTFDELPSRSEVVAHLDDPGLFFSDGTLPLVRKPEHAAVSGSTRGCVSWIEGERDEPVADLHAGQAGAALDLLDLPMRRIVRPFGPQILQDAQFVGSEDRALRLLRRRR